MSTKVENISNVMDYMSTWNKEAQQLGSLYSLLSQQTSDKLVRISNEKKMVLQYVLNDIFSGRDTQKSIDTISKLFSSVRTYISNNSQRLELLKENQIKLASTEEQLQNIQIKKKQFLLEASETISLEQKKADLSKPSKLFELTLENIKESMASSTILEITLDDLFDNPLDFKKSSNVKYWLSKSFRDITNQIANFEKKEGPFFKSLKKYQEYEHACKLVQDKKDSLNLEYKELEKLESVIDKSIIGFKGKLTSTTFQNIHSSPELILQNAIIQASLQWSEHLNNNLNISLSRKILIDPVYTKPLYAITQNKGIFESQIEKFSLLHAKETLIKNEEKNIKVSTDNINKIAETFKIQYTKLSTIQKRKRNSSISWDYRQAESSWKESKDSLNKAYNKLKDRAAHINNNFNGTNLNKTKAKSKSNGSSNAYNTNTTTYSDDSSDWLLWWMIYNNNSSTSPMQYQDTKIVNIHDQVNTMNISDITKSIDLSNTSVSISDVTTDITQTFDALYTSTNGNNVSIDSYISDNSSSCSSYSGSSCSSSSGSSCSSSSGSSCGSSCGGGGCGS